MALVLVLRDGTYVAEPSTAPESTPAPAGAAATTLERLAAALARGDGEAARALAADGSGADLAALAANARALRVRSLSLRYVDQVTPLDDRGRWTAAAEVTWRFAGADTGTARAEVDVRLDSADGGAEVVGFGAPEAAPARLPVWLGGPVDVARTADTLVVAAEGVEVGRYARTARRAIPRVRRVLPGWAGPLVVEVPPDGDAVSAALGAEPAEYANVAAVTAKVDGDDTNPDAPVHVFANPDVFGDLGDRGAQVVMTHEAVHVATGPPASARAGTCRSGCARASPTTWPCATSTCPAAAPPRRSSTRCATRGCPPPCPTPQDFDSADEQFGAAYEAAWLANRGRGGARG